jgi:hypothetical protein
MDRLLTKSTIDDSNTTRRNPNESTAEDVIARPFAADRAATDDFTDF